MPMELLIVPNEYRKIEAEIEELGRLAPHQIRDGKAFFAQLDKRSRQILRHKNVVQKVLDQKLAHGSHHPGPVLGAQLQVLIELRSRLDLYLHEILRVKNRVLNR